MTVNGSSHPAAPPTRPVDTELLAQFLSRHDAPCPMCGYSLKGLTSASCPECGSALVLQVKPAEPRMGSWTAGLIGLASGFGFFLVVAGILTWAAVVEGPSLDELFETWPIWLGLVTCAGLIGLWLRFSGRIRRMSRRWRVGLALMSWVFSGVTTISLLWLTIVILF